MPDAFVPHTFLELARNFRLLSELAPEQLRKLLPLAEEMHFRRGELIFREDDKSFYLHLIVQGEVALEMEAGRGATPVRVQTLEAGEAMGWSALSNGARAHFRARALGPVETIAFRGEDLRSACEDDPELGYALMKRLLEVAAERLDAARMQVVNLRK